MLRFGGLHPPRRLFGSANAASREMKLPRLFLEWHEAPHQLQSTSISKIISLYKRSRVFASSHLSLVQHVPIVSRGTNDKPWNRFQPGKENAFVTTYKSWQYICIHLRGANDVTVQQSRGKGYDDCFTWWKTSGTYDLQASEIRIYGRSRLKWRP